jgi:hypothetical protein
MPNGSPVISSRTRLTMMLGEVPTRVMRPPSSEPNAIGISMQEGEVRERFAIWKAAGISMASAPIFFTIAGEEGDRADEDDELRAHASKPPVTRPSAASTMPERATAALITSADATMMTMSSAKPEKALSAGTMPTSTRRAARGSRPDRSGSGPR